MQFPQGSNFGYGPSSTETAPSLLSSDLSSRNMNSKKRKDKGHEGHGSGAAPKSKRYKNITSDSDAPNEEELLSLGEDYSDIDGKVNDLVDSVLPQHNTLAPASENNDIEKVFLELQQDEDG